MKAISMDEAIRKIMADTINTINKTCIACNTTDGEVCEKCIASRIVCLIYDFRKNN